MGTKRAYFMGAGASYADGVPLTRDLIYGLAYVVCDSPNLFNRIQRFLQTVFQIKESDLKKGAECWNDFIKNKNLGAFTNNQVLLPDIIELLSLLDVLITDESIITGGHHHTNRKFKAFTARELSRIRQSVSRGVSSAFYKAFSNQEKSNNLGYVTNSFVEKLVPTDIIITTNWDLLLDRALHKKYDTYASSVGSDVIIVNEPGDPVSKVSKQNPRPPLFKLHGSFNWLTCPRCTRVYVNPTVYIAELEKLEHKADWNSCECSMPLNALLITPTYFKQYRNRHLINIWAHAQEELANCDEWYFIGYSLPTDDVHIRAFLLRSFHMYKDKHINFPNITVVTKGANLDVKNRYERLFNKVEIKDGGFEKFLENMVVIKK